MMVPAPKIPANKVTSRYKAPPRPAPKPPVRTPPAVVGPAPRPLTAQQWADSQAQRIVDEQIAAIRDRQAAANQALLEQAQQQAADAQRFAAMVQGLGIPQQIQGIYSQGGQDIAGMAQGFAGDIRDIAARDAAAQTRMVSGTGQEGAVRNEGTGMGDVVYGVGGYIPGKSMGEAGAAFASDAARAPGFMLQQRVGDAQKAYNQALQESNQNFLDAILKATTSKTDISSELYKQRVGESLQAQKMRLDQFNQDRNYWLKMQAYYQATGKLKLAKDAEKRAGQAEKRYQYESMGRDAAGNVAPGYVQLPNGTLIKRTDLAAQKREERARMKDKGLAPDGTVLPGYKRQPDGTVVKVATTKPTSAKTMTPAQKAGVLDTVAKKEKDITKTDLPQLAKQTGYDALLKNPKASAKEKTRLQTSIARALWVRYSPFAVTPASKAVLRRMISRLVKAYTPSTGGSLTEGLLP